MQVSGRDFHPSWLSYMGYIASVSEILQSVETTGNSQLTLDDAIHFDHGTRMALLMFNAEGNEDSQNQQLPSARQSDFTTGWSVRAPLVRKHQ